MKKSWRALVIIASAFFVLSSFPRGVWASQNFDLAVTLANGKIQERIVRASSLSAALTYERNQLGVKYVEVNQIYHASLIPNDPNFPDQTALTQIAAPQVWDTRTDASSIIVAVLDSGVDSTNPDLVGNIWTNPGEIAGNGKDDDGNGYVDDVHGWNFVENTNDSRPQRTPGATVAGMDHGTVVAGIIGAQGNNAIAGTGVAWHVSILPVRILDSTGSGTTVTVAQGIQYAVAQGARVINLSFVGTGTSQTLQDAINAAYSKGVLVVAAAGNTNSDLNTTPQYPVCYAHVLGVAAVSAADVKSSFSNYGSCVDVSAPGENIFSTLYYDVATGFPNLAGGGWYGTSVASPFVAGAAALALANEPALTPDGLTALIQKSSVSIDALNPQYLHALGTGRLSVASLFSNVKSVLIKAQDILTIPFRGDSPRVREYTSAGKLLAQFWSGDSKNQNGNYVASGDLDGDGVPEIVTSEAHGGQPWVRVYSRTGTLRTSFLAYDKKFTGGVTVVVGDVTGDGVPEIITGTESGSTHVRVFSSSGKVLGQFFALDPKYHGGVRLAVADANGDGVPDIVVASASSNPRIALYTYTGKFIRSFLAFPTTYHNGVNVAAGDVNGDGVPEIIIGEVQGTTRVRELSLTGKLLKEFTAYPSVKSGGVNVAVGDMNADGLPEIITGTGAGAPPEIRVWQDVGKKRLSVFSAYRATSRSGIAVSTITAK